MDDDRGRKDRRQVLKAFILGGAATTVVLPAAWHSPLVRSVIVPAHAQASPRDVEEEDKDHDEHHKRRKRKRTTTTGDPNATTTAAPTTTSDPLCGNGVLEAAEACDDGNNISGDGCSATCQFEQS